MHIKSQLSEKRNRRRTNISPEHHTCYPKTAYNKEPKLVPFNNYKTKAISFSSNNLDDNGSKSTVSLDNNSLIYFTQSLLQGL